MSTRYPELDLLRTVAILCMVIFHGAYDLAFFHNWDIPVLDGGWRIFQIFTASLFLFLVGVSFAISASKKNNQAELWKTQRKRFVQIGTAALVVTIATWNFDPQTYVRFGILHLIAVSMLLLPFVRSLKERSIMAGIAVIILLMIVRSTEFLQPVFLIIGFPPPGMTTVDYFPLIPWLGVILIGYGLGYLLYVRSTDWREILPETLPMALTLPGRYSLPIYLIHQPIILAVLWLVL